jgi:hypothetical protein
MADHFLVLGRSLVKSKKLIAYFLLLAVLIITEYFLLTHLKKVNISPNPENNAATNSSKDEAGLIEGTNSNTNNDSNNNTTDASTNNNSNEPSQSIAPAMDNNSTTVNPDSSNPSASQGATTHYDNVKGSNFDEKP